jgi:ABC-type glycerol-3-phosphate transport system substrate-binding protein
VEKVKGKFKHLAAFGVLAVLAGSAVAATGCGPKKPEGAGNRTVVMYQAAFDDTDTRAYYNELVNTYNSGQGVTDNVFVQMVTGSGGAISGLDNALMSGYPYDVVQIGDTQIKGLVSTGRQFFVELDQYLTADVKASMEYDQIPAGLKNRFCMNQTTENNKYLAGEGTATLGLPMTNVPHVMWYNVAAMKTAGINVISVSETELETSEQYAKVQPHGYAEYAESHKPFEGAKTSKNEAGQIVYKVFNDRIAMNWEETRCLSRAFMTQYDFEYGYISEWWYNYGWSVGGDCVGWDETAGAYKFTIGDDQDNYLVLADVTVNGRKYKAGDVLLYEDKAKVNSDATLKTTLQNSLHVLPSMRDATLEFNRLSIPTSKYADTGLNGYGVSAESLANRTSKFTSGKCPFYNESYENANTFKASMPGGVDIAPLTQWREYQGGSTYQKNGASGFANEYLKVIGKQYGETVYTGELDKDAVSGVPFVGRQSGYGEFSALIIPVNSDSSNYEAAWKFIRWAASEEGQRIFMKTGNVPNQSALALSDEYALLGGERNYRAAAVAAQGAEIGDWAYFNNGDWVDNWSGNFNQALRLGYSTPEKFMQNFAGIANGDIGKVSIVMNGRW